MLTTLKSGTTVEFSGIPVHICTDVEVEVEETALSTLGPVEADALSIPCTLRHHQPPHSVATLVEVKLPAAGDAR